MTSSSGSTGQSSGSGGKKPPTFIECSVCGKEFGSRSIGIHEPQCLQKLRKTEIANNSEGEQPHQGRNKGMRRKKKSSKEKDQQQSNHTYSDQYYGSWGEREQVQLRQGIHPISYFVEGEDNNRSKRDVVETGKVILPRIQHNSLINYKAFAEHSSSSKSQARRPRTATLSRPKILNLDFIQYDMSLTRLDFSSPNLAASSSSASSPSPIDPNRMDDNQNNVGGREGGNSFMLPVVTTSAPSSTKASGTFPYHHYQSAKLSKNSDGATGASSTKLPPKEDAFGEPFQKWNLNCTSSSSNTAVDNELSLVSNPLRQSATSLPEQVNPWSFVKAPDPNEYSSSSDPSLLPRVRVNENEDAETRQGDEVVNLEEIMNRSVLYTSPKSIEQCVTVRSDAQHFVTPAVHKSGEEGETFPNSSGRGDCLPPQQAEAEVGQQGKVITLNDSPKCCCGDYSYVYEHEGEEQGAEGRPTDYIQTEFASSTSQEIIILKPSAGVVGTESMEVVSPTRSCSGLRRGVNIPIQLPELKANFPMEPPVAPNPELIAQGGLIGIPTHLLQSDAEEDIDSIVTSDAEEFHSVINTDCEDDLEEDLTDDHKPKKDLKKGSSSPAVLTDSEAPVEEDDVIDEDSIGKDSLDNRSSSASSSSHSQASVLETFRNLVGSIFPSCSRVDDDIIPQPEAESKPVDEDQAVLPQKSEQSVKDKFEGNILMKLVGGTTQTKEIKNEQVDSSEEHFKHTDTGFQGGLSVYNPLPLTSSSSATNLTSHSSPITIPALRSPSENNLVNNNAVIVLGTGSETDDESSNNDITNKAGSRMCFPAHEVTSSRTLIRKKFYKKRRDRTRRVKEVSTGTSEKQVPLNHEEPTLQQPPKELDTSKRDRPRLLAIRPKSATDHTPVSSSKAANFSRASLKTVGDSREAGDGRRRSSGKKAGKGESDVVDSLVSALVRLHSIHKGKRPYTANCECNGSRPSTSTSTTTPTPKSMGRTPWTSSKKTGAGSAKKAGGSNAAPISKRPWSTPHSASFEDSSPKQSRPPTPKPTSASMKKVPVSKKDGAEGPKPGIRQQTIERLSTPRVLTEGKPLFSERVPGWRVKITQRKPATISSESKTQSPRKEVVTSAYKPSESGDKGDSERLTLAPFQRFPQNKEEPQEKETVNIEILLKRNLTFSASTEGSLQEKPGIIRKVSGGKRRAITQVCKATQTRRSGRKGILKNPSGEGSPNTIPSENLTVQFAETLPLPVCVLSPPSSPLPELESSPCSSVDKPHNVKFERIKEDSSSLV